MSSVSSAPAFDNSREAGKRGLWIFVVIVWGLTMVAAFGAVWRYKTTPGSPPSMAPASWPADLGLPRSPERATIVMLAHPKCPCTRASLSELARLMTSLGSSARAHVLFFTPKGAPEGWERSDTWARAAEIPNVEVVADHDGLLAARLGATVSGHTVVYDAKGKLVFYGGITSARGHEGDNAGRSTIVSKLTAAATSDEKTSLAKAVTPTFGCELADASTSTSTSTGGGAR